MGQSEDRHREMSGNSDVNGMGQPDGGNGDANGSDGSDANGNGRIGSNAGGRPALSNWIRSARRDRGLTQQEVASKVGITVRSISGWESGKTVPHVGTLATLARVLGQEPQRLAATAQEMTGRRRAAKVDRLAPRIEGALNEMILNLRTGERS